MQVGGSGSGSGGSGSLELLADPQLRNVQWPELTIVRRVGRGSFGSVYVAEWKRIHVAVKLLVSQGKCGAHWMEAPWLLASGLLSIARECGRPANSWLSAAGHIHAATLLHYCMGSQCACRLH